MVFVDPIPEFIDPITPYLPSSMLQTKKTQGYISEELAAPFGYWEKVGY